MTKRREKSSLLCHARWTYAPILELYKYFFLVLLKILFFYLLVLVQTCMSLISLSAYIQAFVYLLD